jgi:5-methyltetrahydropteroyltriglutamate--homocysteine methyltransferase
VARLEAKDFSRLPKRAERLPIQQERLKLPALPTTTIGSFPQTAQVRELRARFRKGLIDKCEYDEAIKKFVADCVKSQEDIGLDVLVHGEFERNDMVEFFGQNLNGFAFTANGWVQSYGTRYVKPPIVAADVFRAEPITVGLAAYAQSLTKKPVKGMLTGPVTILNWSFPREDISLGECAYQIALAIRDEVLDLEKNGLTIIQIDEAALREKMPLRRAERKVYFDWAIAAFKLTHSGTRPETQIHTHMCYSDFTDILPEIDAMDADVISFEASRSNLELLDFLAAADFQTAVGAGVYDIHSPRVPSQDEIETAIHATLSKMGRKSDHYDQVWVNPDCGLKTREDAEVWPSLINLVRAAQRIRDAHRG